MMNNITTSSYETSTSVVKIGNKEIRVATRIPDNVRNRQEKINKIYDILKPHHKVYS